MTVDSGFVNNPSDIRRRATTTQNVARQPAKSRPIPPFVPARAIKDQSGICTARIATDLSIQCGQESMTDPAGGSGMISHFLLRLRPPSRADIISVDILKSLSDGYSIIPAGGFAPCQQLRQGPHFDPAPCRLLSTDSTAGCTLLGLSRRRVGPLVHPDPRRPSSLFVWDANRAGMDQLLTPEFWKIQIEVARADSRGAKPACAMT